MPFQLFNTSVDFLASLGGTPFSTQNFESFSDGDNLNGVEFIPGVFVTSNLPRVEAFRGSGDTELFILDRQSVAEDAFYDINFSQPFNAVGFDIDAFDPATPGPAILDIFFSDGDSTSFNIFPTNPTESDPIFFGIVADKNISKIRLTEGPEIGGFGNEEIALDNFIVPRSAIANIPSQTVSHHLTSGGFAWDSQFDWEFTNQIMSISLNIDLIGANPGNLVNVWEQGIEGIWSNRYNIIDGIYTYPIVFDVNFVDVTADQVVTVHSGTGRSNMTNWYLDRPGGWDNSYQDEIAAHEFGHMLGLYDEYAGGAVNPNINPNVFTNSIMADLGLTQRRHYEEILQLLSTATSRDLSLALSPLPPYPMDTPIPDFGQTEVPPGGTIQSTPIVGTPNDDNLTGTPSNDTIDLGNSQDIANGLAGDDVINGGDGDDRLFGGEDNDTLLGGSGQDRLFGEAGDDLLDGGAGDNTLNGGSGSDIFVVSTEGKNTIVDFEDGQDLLKLVGGLTFESLSIFNQNGDTWITTNNNQPLAFLTGVDASLITAADFTV